ncbi:MAG: YraN family protein [Ruminococcus callidus]
MKMKTTEIGRLGETAVCRQLEQQGYSIVRRNFCVRGGEIDIIAENGEYLAFVEVKTRKPNSLTSGFDDVTAKTGSFDPDGSRVVQNTPQSCSRGLILPAW